MNIKAIDHIRANNVCVLTTLISDGGPHSAAMFFAFDANEKEFYFLADLNDLKCEALSEQTETFSSIVIGQDSEEWRTLQLRGSIVMVPVAEEDYLIKKHFVEMPQLKNFIEHEDRVVLKFIPAWWKFTDSGDGSITVSD